MKRAPMFDVMMMIVFLKFTRLPRPSVRWPSSNTCSRMLKMSGCAFSISSSSTTEYGFRFTFSVSWPPSSWPTYPGGEPISFETECFSMYSDMSKRISAWSLPNRKLASARASSVLPTPVGPEEHEAADRTVRVLQPGARAADGARERRDRLLLADDALVQLRLHPQQLVAFVLVDRRQRHAGPLRDDLVDLRLADDDLARARLDVELLADELQVLARRHFLLAVELRLLEVLLRDRALHLLDGDADALVDLAELLAVAGLAQLGARAGLVDEVDGLVGQEAIGDVAVRLVDRRLDRLARVLDVVELLVAILDAEQDLDRLALAGRIDLDRLEAALERAVLLDVLPVLGRRRRADAADLAALTAPASGCWPRRASLRPTRRRPACAARR